MSSRRDELGCAPPVSCVFKRKTLYPIAGLTGGDAVSRHWCTVQRKLICPLLWQVSFWGKALAPWGWMVGRRSPCQVWFDFVGRELSVEWGNFGVPRIRCPSIYSEHSISSGDLARSQETTL